MCMCMCMLAIFRGLPNPTPCMVHALWSKPILPPTCTQRCRCGSGCGCSCGIARSSCSQAGAAKQGQHGEKVPAPVQRGSPLCTHMNDTHKLTLTLTRPGLGLWGVEGGAAGRQAGSRRTCGVARRHGGVVVVVARWGGAGLTVWVLCEGVSERSWCCAVLRGAARCCAVRGARSTV
jgi:hypothetical protein